MQPPAGQGTKRGCGLNKRRPERVGDQHDGNLRLTNTKDKYETDIIGKIVGNWSGKRCWVQHSFRTDLDERNDDEHDRDNRCERKHQYEQ